MLKTIHAVSQSVVGEDSWEKDFKSALLMQPKLLMRTCCSVLDKGHKNTFLWVHMQCQRNPEG